MIFRSIQRYLINYAYFPNSTTSTLSVGSTGSQARLIQSSHAPSNYQPVLLKDLGKQNNDLSTSTTTTTGSANELQTYFVDDDVDENGSNNYYRNNKNNHNNYNNKNDDLNANAKITKTRNDDEKYTDKVMDNHLKVLERETSIETDMTQDIEKYMENLKEKHYEYQQVLTKNTINSDKKAIKGLPPRTDSSDAGISTGPETTSQTNTSDESPAEELKTKIVTIDKKVDKVFVSSERRKSTGDKGSSTPKGDGSQTPKKILKSPRQSIELSRSPDRSKSTGSSPVKIYRVKTPKDSLDIDRLTVIKQSSRDKSPETEKGRRHSPSQRRSSEAGILKRSLSPKTDKDGVPVGILKRSASPNKARSPDGIRKSLSPCSSFDIRSPNTGLSPRGSICESRSPDRMGSRLCVQSSVSPRGSFDSRSPDRGYDHPRLLVRNNSPRSSFESRSPDRGRRSLSASARSSFDSQRSSERYYKYSPYPSFECSSPERDPKRPSKSLDRSPRNTSPYGNAPPYYLPPDPRYFRQDSAGSQRSYSDETIIARPAYPDYPPSSGFSADSLHRLPVEHPTCVECLYSRKPS